MWFGASVWDPTLIVAQMAIMQSLMYLNLGTLVYFGVPALTGRTKHSLAHTDPCAKALGMVLDPDCTNSSSAQGWVVVACWVATAVVVSFALVTVVERAKKCLDFVATAHGVHFVIACLYAQKLPTTVAFYCTQIFCVVLSAVLGEWLCLRRELREIPLGNPSSAIAD